MLTPEDFEACLSRCYRRTLIARVSAAQAEAAPTDGLLPFRPGPDATYDASHPTYLEPRPGCVYLAKPGGRRESDHTDAVVVDMTALEPGAFVVDEHAYFREVLWASSDPYEPLLPPDGELPAAVVSRIGCNTSLDNGRPSTGEWINSVGDELDVSAQVRRCFEQTDGVAYDGAIPAAAIVTTFSLREDPDTWVHLPY